MESNKTFTPDRPSTREVGVRLPMDECVNAATHGVGFVLSVIGTVVLFRAPVQLSLGLLLTCGAYTASLMAVYAISALSHAVQEPHRKHTLQMWDQGLIYLLIAGTYTPLMWVFLPSYLRWVALGLVWAAAVAGKYSKVVARQRITKFSAVSYLCLGWLPALIFLPSVPQADALVWIFAGGLSYTAGTFFLTRDWQWRYFHAVWHLFVMAGSACHFYAIYWFALPHG